MNKGSFNVSDQQLIGMAENKPTLQVKVKLKMSGEDMDVLVPVMFRNVDPAIGEFLHPVYVIPSQVTTTPLNPLLVNTNSKVNSANASNTGSDIPFMHVISYEHIPTLVYFSKNDQMVVKSRFENNWKANWLYRGSRR